VTKTEDVLTHTLTEGTQDDAHGLTDIAVPCFKSLLVGQDLSLRGICPPEQSGLFSEQVEMLMWEPQEDRGVPLFACSRYCRHYQLGVLL